MRIEELVERQIARVDLCGRAAVNRRECRAGAARALCFDVVGECGEVVGGAYDHPDGNLDVEDLA